MGEHVTKLTSLHSLYTKNIYSKFHRNLMNQNWDMLENIHLGHDRPNCPAHFYPFCQKGFFSEHAVFAEWEDHQIFHFKAIPAKTNDSISQKSWKPWFWVTLDPFCPKKGQLIFFLQKSVTFLRLWTPNFMQEIKKNLMSQFWELTCH